jgi:hypothetical protein
LEVQQNIVNGRHLSGNCDRRKIDAIWGNNQKSKRGLTLFFDFVEVTFVFNVTTGSAMKELWLVICPVSDRRGYANIPPYPHAVISLAVYFPPKFIGHPFTGFFVSCEKNRRISIIAAQGCRSRIIQ